MAFIIRIVLVLTYRRDSLDGAAEGGRQAEVGMSMSERGGPAEERGAGMSHGSEGSGCGQLGG